MIRHRDRHKEKGHGFGARIINKTANAILERYHKDGSDNLIARSVSKRLGDNAGANSVDYIFQVARGKNKGGIKEISPTVSASDFEYNNLLVFNAITRRSGSTARGQDFIKDKQIRRLTPKECERLQGFPDDWTEGVSDTQRYKQMGNAVSVPVIEAMGRKILERVT